MKYDLAKLMQDALQNNITKKASDEKHPLQVEFETKHNIDLSEYINKTYKYSDSEFDRDIMMLLKNLLMPNLELGEPLTMLTKYWSDENDNVTILSVYKKLEELQNDVSNKLDDNVMSGYNIDEEFARETVALEEYDKSGIENDEELAKYIEHFEDNMSYSSEVYKDDERMKQAIHPKLMEALNLN